MEVPIRSSFFKKKKITKPQGRCTRDDSPRRMQHVRTAFTHSIA